MNSHEQNENKESQTDVDFCFVIMPFRGWFDKYYTEIYKPAIEKAGLIAVRADDIFQQGNIIRNILALTVSSKIMVADLTNTNPNVYYELGLAHALGKPVILVIDDIDNVPFDLRHQRVIQYDKNSPKWGDELAEKLCRSITDTLKAPASATLPLPQVDNVTSPLQKLSTEDQLMALRRHDLDMLLNATRQILQTSGYPPSHEETQIFSEIFGKIVSEYSSIRDDIETKLSAMSSKSLGDGNSAASTSKDMLLLEMQQKELLVIRQALEDVLGSVLSTTYPIDPELSRTIMKTIQSLSNGYFGRKNTVDQHIQRLLGTSGAE